MTITTNAEIYSRAAKSTFHELYHYLRCNRLFAEELPASGAHHVYTMPYTLDPYSFIEEGMADFFAQVCKDKNPRDKYSVIHGMLGNWPFDKVAALQSAYDAIADVPEAWSAKNAILLKDLGRLSVAADKRLPFGSLLRGHSVVSIPEELDLCIDRFINTDKVSFPEVLSTYITKADEELSDMLRQSVVPAPDTGLLESIRRIASKGVDVIKDMTGLTINPPEIVLYKDQNSICKGFFDEDNPSAINMNVHFITDFSSAHTEEQYEDLWKYDFGRLMSVLSYVANGFDGGKAIHEHFKSTNPEMFANLVETIRADKKNDGTIGADLKKITDMAEIEDFARFT
jgi:hypothetical protein